MGGCAPLCCVRTGAHIEHSTTRVRDHALGVLAWHFDQATKVTQSATSQERQGVLCSGERATGAMMAMVHLIW
jgi:hypothetical protein